MNVLKHCLNWKVLVGLGAVGLGIYLFAPGLVAAALPILLLAACPLSMIFMMKAMHGGQGESQGGAREDRQARQSGASPSTREEELVRLRARQVALDEQIEVLELERDNAPRARDGR